MPMVRRFSVSYLNAYLKMVISCILFEKVAVARTWQNTKHGYECAIEQYVIGIEETISVNY